MEKPTTETAGSGAYSIYPICSINLRVNSACIFSPETGLTKSSPPIPVQEHCEICVFIASTKQYFGIGSVQWIHHPAFPNYIVAAERKVANCAEVMELSHKGYQNSIKKAGREEQSSEQVNCRRTEQVSQVLCCAWSRNTLPRCFLAT